LQRLQRWTFAQGVLVADCAFLLKAEPAPSQLELWAAERRAKGRRIIALNLHPMLFPEDSRERQTAHVVEKARDAIVEVSRRRNVAWLLLPHDLREVIGDEACLRSLFDDLRPQLGDDIEFYNHADPASVLKGAAGLADGIVTARMHLAIAGLSQGVPVSCITYQDKFEGSFRHFELDTKYLMAPSSALEGQQLLNLIAQFVDEIPVLKDRVMERLPFVMELAKKNYDSH
jgi:polysaccharide pyruvyl transferase WcaK-like protein